MFSSIILLNAIIIIIINLICSSKWNYIYIFAHNKNHPLGYFKKKRLCIKQNFP